MENYPSQTTPCFASDEHQGASFYAKLSLVLKDKTCYSLYMALTSLN